MRRLLSPAGFDLDPGDRVISLITLTNYWELKCEKAIQEKDKGFAAALKARIER